MQAKHLMAGCEDGPDFFPKEKALARAVAEAIKELGGK